MTERELMGIAMGLTSALTWATSSLLFGRIFDRTPPELCPSPAGANLFKNSLALGVFAILWWVLADAAPVGADWYGLLESGFLGFAVADTVYFAAISLCGVQLAAMIGLLNVPIATLLSWIWLKQHPTPGMAIWMGVVLAGVLIVLLDRRHGVRLRRRAGPPPVELAQVRSVSDLASLRLVHVLDVPARPLFRRCGLSRRSVERLGPSRRGGATAG